jgi:hypothetical protein
VFVSGLDSPVVLGGDGQFCGRVLVVQREAGLCSAAVGVLPNGSSRSASPRL